jgi:hypothetical protein
MEIRLTGKYSRAYQRSKQFVSDLVDQVTPIRRVNNSDEQEGANLGGNQGQGGEDQNQQGGEAEGGLALFEEVAGEKALFERNQDGENRQQQESAKPDQTTEARAHQIGKAIRRLTKTTFTTLSKPFYYYYWNYSLQTPKFLETIGEEFSLFWWQLRQEIELKGIYDFLKDLIQLTVIQKS